MHLLPNAGRKTKIGGPLFAFIVRKTLMTSNSLSVGMVGSELVGGCDAPARARQPSQDPYCRRLRPQSRQRAKEGGYLGYSAGVYRLQRYDRERRSRCGRHCNAERLSLPDYDEGTRSGIARALREADCAHLCASAGDGGHSGREGAQDIGALHIQLHAHSPISQGADRRRLHRQALPFEPALLHRASPARAIIAGASTAK